MRTGNALAFNSDNESKDYNKCYYAILYVVSESDQTCNILFLNG